MAQPVYKDFLNYPLNDSSPDMRMHFATTATTRKLHSKPHNLRQSCQMEPKERLAAFLVHEPHVEAILRLLLEMSEEQRRMSLMMMQCIGLGASSPPLEAE